MSRQNTDKVKIDLRISKKLKDKFIKKCEKEGRNISEVIRSLIAIYTKSKQTNLLINFEKCKDD